MEYDTYEDSYDYDLGKAFSQLQKEINRRADSLGRKYGRTAVDELYGLIVKEFS